MKSRNKYMKLVQLYHPDRNPQANQEKFKHMTAAYSVLSNEKTKAQYDKIRKGGSSRTTSQGWSASSNRNWQSYNSGYNQQRSQSNNFYGFKNQYKTYYDQRHEYQRKTDQQRSREEEQARRQYEEWKRSQYEQQKRAYERQREQYQRYYNNYEEFMRDYQKKYGDREQNYQQNFGNRPHEEYEKNYDPAGFDQYGRPINKEEMHINIMNTYYRIFLFALGFLLINSILNSIRRRNKEKEMMFAYQNAIHNGHGMPQTPHTLDREMPMYYRTTPPRYQPRPNEQFYIPVKAKRQD